MGSCGTFAAFFLAMPAGGNRFHQQLPPIRPIYSPSEMASDISELYADAQKISEISKQLLHAQ